MIRQIEAGDLDIAYFEHGRPDGWPVILLHGFPYDIHAYDEVAPLLAAKGARIIVPYLRGYGPTRFRSPSTLRSGEQAVLGHDLLCLMDALALPQAILAGYDWGGRAACIVSALWPQRSAGLVTVNGYNIQNIAAAGEPLLPENELRFWYQYYFHNERGRLGLTHHRHALCKLLWQLWSPNWNFSEQTYEQTARSFENPDFVEVVIHSYRHRFALVAGDPTVAEIETRLARQPAIAVPTISFDGGGDGVMTIGDNAHHASKFTAAYEHRVIPRVGHNLPQEAPQAFAAAILDIRARA